jgi:hypothetical protein
MAKCMNPAFSSETRGRVGGIVYNTWRGARTVKVKTAPAQPRTARQLVIRAFCTTIARRWAILTAPQREGWTTYANAHPGSDWTGSPKRATGLNWFVQLSVRLLDMAKAVVDTAPITVAPPNVIALVCTGGSGQISCAFTPAGGTTTTIDLWTHGPRSAGVISTIVKAKHRLYAPGETSPAVIPTLPAGLYTVYARNVDEVTGLASQWVSATATVT